MKKLKLLAAVLTALTIGALAFADAAADKYLSKFTELVTSVESSAKKNDGSKATTFAAQKKSVDELRKTVTLTTTQRFSDWRLTKRYDAAYEKILAAQKAATAKEDVRAESNKLGKALNDAANQVGGALKETGTQAVNNVKESVNTAAENVKDTAKTKVDDSVTSAANSISDSIQKGAKSLTNAINNFFGSKEKEE